MTVRVLKPIMTGKILTHFFLLIMELAKTSKTDLNNWEKNLLNRFCQYKKYGLKLDLTRGKPGTEQLDLANQMEGLMMGKMITGFLRI